MKTHQIVKVLEDSKIQNASLWIAEAEFGFSHLKDPIISLSPGSDILEVGSGSGILLSMLIEEYPKHNFTGIEPLGGGFSNLRELNSAVRDVGAQVSIEGYEQHQAKYDLIFCVNVFEHVKDWQHFLGWASESLKEGGVFLVLCPNYGFPYESHFKIPVVLNKQLTFRLFKRHILRFERDNQCAGLWDSLNFVKKSEVARVCQEKRSQLGFQMHDDVSIIDHMIRRASADPEFRKRQSMLGHIATALKAVGILALIKKFPNFLPYMKLAFRKENGL